MAEPVIMPKLEMDMEEALIVGWFVEEGGEVETGDPLFEIETSKASLEVEAECSGVLLKILQPADSTVPVTRTIAWIGEEGEEIPGTAEAVVVETPETTPVAGKVPATPAAKALAAEKGIDLSSVAPGGIHGECRKSDVEAAASQCSGERREPLPPIRREIAARMVESGCHIPQATVETKADITELARMRKQINEERGVRLSLTDYVARAAALALREFPICNARLDGSEIVYNAAVHLGIAVATERGLIVPVVRDAQTRDIEGISAEIRSLAARARDGKLMPSEFTGSTFTISNLGMFGTTSFTPILNAPEAAILGVCAAEEVPVLGAGKLENRLRMNLCLTIDHRMLDGTAAAMFLGEVREHLEQPGKLIAN